MKSRKKLEYLIEKYAVPPYKAAYIQEIRPSIRLTCSGEPKGERFSRLGGIPDLPEGTEWPNNPLDAQPYSFLGQIAISEIKSWDVENLLPDQGHLYFFFNMESGDDGRVIFADEAEPTYQPALPGVFKPKRKRLGPIKWASNPGKLFNAQAIDFSHEFHAPSYDSVYADKTYKESGTQVEPFDSIDDPMVEYPDAYFDGEGEMVPKHHLLGHYLGIQNGYLEYELIERESKGPEYSLEDIRNALQWKLLCQIDSDEALGTMFADGGRCYFFIHEQALAKGDFSGVKALVDCY